MSIQRAKLLVSGLRWHHLGFSFFWATTFAALTSSSEDLLGGYESYSFCKQIVVVLVLAIAACVLRARDSYTQRHAIMAGVFLATGSLLFYLAFFFGEYSLEAVLVAGVLVGCSSGGFFVMWQSFYASEGASRTAIYIPLSAACSVVLCLVVSVLPVIWSVVCSVIVLPALATYCLCRSLEEIEPYEIIPCTPRKLSAVFRDLGKPVFCVSALGFVWKLVGYFDHSGESQSFLILMAGMACAALIVTLIELFSERGFDVLAFYRILFPIVTGVFLLPTLFGEVWFSVLSGFLMFGFEVLNLLLLMTCAVYASRNSLNSTVVYALCVVPTLCALVGGDILGVVLNRANVYDFAFVVDVMFVCIYGLSVVMFFASVGRSKRKASRIVAHVVPDVEDSSVVKGLDGEQAARSVEPAPSEEGHASLGGASSKGSSGFDAPVSLVQASNFSAEAGASLSLEERLAELELVEQLSQREREVTGLLLHGNTVPAIARKLFISENTVRGHTKNIYRKLGVHSKQELIDLLG
ncbi:MAG: helix-turn-helix transcriptional regulator [Slackia sp.]|nr:helix-turn-helix transcriptional regulator [Slackia sp.]